jgi:methylated-DNA-[protein]-cysteine S-methyltransferase
VEDGPIRGKESFALLETQMGTCAILWRGAGITRLLLPQSGRGATLRHLRARTGHDEAASPPRRLQPALAKLEKYFAGKQVDLSRIEVDLSASVFHREIYQAARAIPWGGAMTYGELASQVGAPGAARAVGQAMGRNPVPIIIPCHRVLAAGRKIGGFSAYGGVVTKQRLLALEGIYLGKCGPPLPGLLT